MVRLFLNLTLVGFQLQFMQFQYLTLVGVAMLVRLQKLIQLLNDGDFHTCKSLGKKLDRSYSQVLRMINDVIKMGIEIESVRSKGYRFVRKLYLLKKKKIEKYISRRFLKEIVHIDILDEVDSTNDYLMRLANAENKKIRLCFAEYQTHGKGRRGRIWCSPYGTNIYLSILFPFNKDLMSLSGLSLSMAVTIANFLKEIGVKDNIGVKWPNDIVWKDKKISGVLVEVLSEAFNENQVIVGVGLNLHIPKKAAEIIDSKWIDLESIIGEEYKRNKIAGVLANRIMENFYVFEEKGLAAFMKDWKLFDVLQGNTVTLKTGVEKIKGTACGIDKQGHFILERKDGNRQSFSAGEVTICK